MNKSIYPSQLMQKSQGQQLVFDLLSERVAIPLEESLQPATGGTQLLVRGITYKLIEQDQLQQFHQDKVATLPVYQRKGSMTEAVATGLLMVTLHAAKDEIKLLDLCQTLNLKAVRKSQYIPNLFIIGDDEHHAANYLNNITDLQSQKFIKDVSAELLMPVSRR